MKNGWNKNNEKYTLLLPLLLLIAVTFGLWGVYLYHIYA